MALKTNYKIGDDYTADVHNEENTQINQNTTDIASLQSGLKATNANVESNTEDIETSTNNIKTLQSDVDSLEANTKMLKGGVMGQVLAKKSNTDYDASWITLASERFYVDEDGDICQKGE